VVFQVFHADPRPFGRVWPSIKFRANPALVAGVAQGLQDRAGGYIAAIQRGEGEGITLEPLQMDIGNPLCMVADQLRRIAACGGKMGGISSTRASKTNIAPLIDVSWLYKLEPVSFNYRKRTENGAYLDSFEPETQLGMIAEQVAPYAPELCIYDADGKVVGIHYDRMIAPLLKALQDQAVRIASLEKSILSITSTATDNTK
jgi:hypothetical protein